MAEFWILISDSDIKMVHKWPLEDYEERFFCRLTIFNNYSLLLEIVQDALTLELHTKDSVLSTKPDGDMVRKLPYHSSAPAVLSLFCANKFMYMSISCADTADILTCEAFVHDSLYDYKRIMNSCSVWQKVLWRKCKLKFNPWRISVPYTLPIRFQASVPLLTKTQHISTILSCSNYANFMVQ